jgi:hypothetical protein
MTVLQAGALAGRRIARLRWKNSLLDCIVSPINLFGDSLLDRSVLGPTDFIQTIV